jgi:hypothetical protein
VIDVKKVYMFSKEQYLALFLIWLGRTSIELMDSSFRRTGKSVILKLNIKNGMMNWRREIK